MQNCIEPTTSGSSAQHSKIKLDTTQHDSSIQGLLMTIWWVRFLVLHAGQHIKQQHLGLTSVIRKNLPFAFEPRSKKKRLWPARTIWPPVSVSVIVGGDGPGPTTVLLPATPACIITTTASKVASTCFALVSQQRPIQQAPSAGCLLAVLCGSTLP